MQRERDPKRSFRIDPRRKAKSRQKGAARGLRNRYALRNLPPVDLGFDEPDVPFRSVDCEQ